MVRGSLEELLEPALQGLVGLGTGKSKSGNGVRGLRADGPNHSTTPAVISISSTLQLILASRFPSRSQIHGPAPTARNLIYTPTDGPLVGAGRLPLGQSIVIVTGGTLPAHLTARISGTFGFGGNGDPLNAATMKSTDLSMNLLC